ncbi:MAG: hypothetical protein FWD82_02400 [Defluviitaleaceae bacterium]|nr:hypothetical protein [Defluviitaleaceae bacterium]
MSLKKYMAIDLFLMLLILILLEAASAFAFGMFNTEAYVLTHVMTITFLVMMRWGKFSLIHAFAGGIVYSIVYGGTVQNFAIYAIGNLGIAVSLLIFLKFGKERVRLSKMLTIIYCGVGYLGINLSRTLIAFILLREPLLTTLTSFLTTDILSFIITVLAIFIAKRQKGLFHDQKDYLVKLSEEEKLRGK